MVYIEQKKREKQPVYFLPIGQSVYQKSLIDILVQLHKTHILSYLDTLSKGEGFENGVTNQVKLEDTDQDGDIKIGDDKKMDDDSMINAFIFNVKQVINHPTLLVDHYIPRNLLLLNSKENVLGLSYKYHYVSEILDSLITKDVRKTIVICGSNSKELDLIESFLLGKSGLQYYRFSGSSLYYDNHGSFDFNKEENTESENSSSRSTPSPIINISSNNIKKKYSGRSKKISNIFESGSSSPEKNNGNSNSNSSNKKKKKTGRPPSAEKQLLQQQLDEQREREHNEEYIPKLSKNNEDFIKLQNEKKNKKLNVYLILSSQLKYLLNFEDLKSDLIITLDSNFIDFNDITKNLNNKIPIIKPIIIESLEHYEWELKYDLNLDLSLFDNNEYKGFQNQKNKRNTRLNEQNQIKDKEANDISKEDFNKLLILLSIGSLNNVKVDLPSTMPPVSNKVIDWLIDPVNNTYPYESNIETKLPHLINKDIIEIIKNKLNFKYTLNNTLDIEEINKYKFFNNEKNDQINKNLNNEHNNKKIKYNNDNEEFFNEYIPKYFSYQEYQSKLTILIMKMLEEMNKWMNETTYLLNWIHLDETERQNVLDSGNEKCGELFKKNRDLKVLIEGRNKVKERNNIEFNKLKDTNEKLNKRLAQYKDDKVEIKSESNNKSEELLKKVEKLKEDIEKNEQESSLIRNEYQEMSNKAAELSLVVKKIDEINKQLENDSKGIFNDIHLNSIKEKKQYYEDKIQKMKNDESVWKGYLQILNNELEKRNSTVSNNENIRTNGRSRHNTPYN